VGDARLAVTRVSALVQLARGIFSLRFPRSFAFVPGECVPVAADAGMAPRRYSVASGPDDPEVELLFDLVEGGRLTPWLAALEPGDAILVGEPTGSFRDAERRAVWVAAGTGIAPFLSMVRAGRTRDRLLIHGSRTVEGLLYQEDLHSALGAAYVPCCPSGTGPSVFPGRLTAYLLSAEIQARAHYLLCGSPAMVVDVRDLLISRGVPFERIVSEIYF
jgi:ferredoxin--NADP+ reductase